MQTKTNLFLLLCFLCIFIKTGAQVIPDSLRPDWSKAGYTGAIPAPPKIINVKDFGAFGDGVHDDYSAVLNAINSSPKLRVIFFPAGNYLIGSTISLPEKTVLRGEGSATVLSFNLSSGQNCIEIRQSQTKSFIPADSGYNKGSVTLKLSNVTGFAVNGYAQIQETNGSWDTQPATWAANTVGQIVKITSVSGNYITFAPALRLDFTASLNPVIRPVTLKKKSGVECLTIKRLDAPAGSYGDNIFFQYALNCWVAGVESNMSQGSHFFLSASKNITITGCYIHHSFTYDGSGTSGYGITMVTHTSDCKVENTIFQHLRHSMVGQQGANGNVFAYNYSSDPYRSEIPHDYGADMLLHGHYPFANLFEGNIGQFISIDQTNGPSGPYNTYFRNRAEGYGIAITSGSVNSNRQNFVGNEVTNSGLKGNYSLAGSNHFTYGNNIRGTVQPAGTNALADKSYYLKKKPVFWNIAGKWPSIGISSVINTGTNPAKERWLSGSSKTVCPVAPAAFINTISPAKENELKAGLIQSVYASGNTVYVRLNNPCDKKMLVTLYDATGRNILARNTGNMMDKNIMIADKNLSAGYYFLKLVCGDKMESRQVLIVK